VNSSCLSDADVRFVLQREEKEVPQEKKDDQKALDAILLPIIEKIPDLKSYLASRFSLKSGVKPHELVF
jgi:large subunit ribosomal protein L6e